MRLIDCVDHVYVLNLPERTDRLRQAEQQLERLGLTPGDERVTIFAAQRPTQAAPFHQIGTKGNFLSFSALLRDAQKRGFSRILALEDDVDLRSEFLDNEPVLARQIADADFDVAQLGYSAHSLTMPFDHLDPVDGVTLEEYDGELIHAHCVVYSHCETGRFADFLDELITRPQGHPDGGPMPFDGAINVYSRRNDVRRLIAVPRLAFQASSRSDITPGRLDEVPVARQALALLRRLGLTTRFRRH